MQSIKNFINKTCNLTYKQDGLQIRGINYVRKLYEVTEQAFGGRKQPTQEAIRKVQQQIMSIPLEQLGYGQDVQQKYIDMGFQEIYENNDYTIGIFIIPQGKKIPFHDHPDMIVISRLLFGQLQVRSFDWRDKQAQRQQSGEAISALDTTINAKGTTQALVLYPNKGGNIHEFTAIQDCAILDVLAPPYDSKEGRNCTYYNLRIEGQNFFLTSKSEPVELGIRRVPYQGMPVFE